MTDHDIRLKKLIYQSTHRGGKELDMILGGFAKSHAKDFSPKDIAVFEQLLQMDDKILKAWFLSDHPVQLSQYNVSDAEKSLIDRINLFKKSEML